MQSRAHRTCAATEAGASDDLERAGFGYRATVPAALLDELPAPRIPVGEARELDWPEALHAFSAAMRAWRGVGR